MFIVGVDVDAVVVTVVLAVVSKHNLLCFGDNHAFV